MIQRAHRRPLLGIQRLRHRWEQCALNRRGLTTTVQESLHHRFHRLQPTAPADALPLNQQRRSITLQPAAVDRKTATFWGERHRQLSLLKGNEQITR